MATLITPLTVVGLQPSTAAVLASAPQFLEIRQYRTQPYPALATYIANPYTGSSGAGGVLASNGASPAAPFSEPERAIAPLTPVARAAAGLAQSPTGAGLVVQLRPGQDIQSMVDASPEGTTFLVQSGVHRLQTISPKSGQTFVGENGAVLSGARVLRTFARSGRAWVASGQTQQGDSRDLVAARVCRKAYLRCVRPEDLFIDDRPLQHVSSFGAGGPGKWYFDYAADRIYVWENPTGRTVEAGVTSRAFTGSGSNVIIRNLVIEKYAVASQDAAVRLGPDWIIEDSEIRLNHFAGIWTGPTSISRRNHVHHNGSMGFHGAGDGILVEDNQISYNGYAGYDPFWGAGGAKWVYTRGLVARGNFVHHNLGPGLWTDINNIHSLYEDNTVDDNERGGIFHEISYDAVIRRNTVRRNGTGKDFPNWTTGAGIEIVSSRNVKVYGNSLEDNWQGITGLDDHRGAGNDGPWTLINLDVHSNVITSRLKDPGSGRTGIVDTRGLGAFSAAANNTFRQNLYVLGPNRKYFMWSGVDRTEAEWQALRQDTMGTFQR